MLYQIYQLFLEIELLNIYKKKMPFTQKILQTHPVRPLRGRPPLHRRGIITQFTCGVQRDSGQRSAISGQRISGDSSIIYHYVFLIFAMFLIKNFSKSFYRRFSAAKVDSRCRLGADWV